MEPSNTLKEEIDRLENGTQSFISSETQHYLDSLKPSEVKATYFIYATNKQQKLYEFYNNDCGKWMIFAEKGKKLDLIWSEIKRLTEEGFLVDICKVSTQKENIHASNSHVGVICVYTYSSSDKKDLLRVAGLLLDIPNTNRLVYKEDAVTGEGKYANKGHKMISKYVVTKEDYKIVLAS